MSTTLKLTLPTRYGQPAPIWLKADHRAYILAIPRKNNARAPVGGGMGDIAGLVCFRCPALDPGWRRSLYVASRRRSHGGACGIQLGDHGPGKVSQWLRPDSKVAMLGTANPAPGVRFPLRPPLSPQRSTNSGAPSRTEPVWGAASRTFTAHERRRRGPSPRREMCAERAPRPRMATMPIPTRRSAASPPVPLSPDRAHEPEISPKSPAWRLWSGRNRSDITAPSLREAGLDHGSGPRATDGFSVVAQW